MNYNSSLLNLILVSVLTVPLSAVTVSSAICPTNKIAPHRRISRNWNAGYQGRTLGAFYDLLAPGPGGLQGYNPSLQEEPQRDDPDDCGDIEDYDENDLSSLTPNYQRGDRYNYGNGRLFFGIFNGPLNSQRPQHPSPDNSQYPQYPQNGPQRPQYPQNRPQQPQYPPQNRPQQPQRPNRRPPYASGGYFANNPYHPPVQHYPSDEVKPVYDGVDEAQTTYRPHVIGGPIGHVVGVTPRPRPTRRPDYQDYVRYPTTLSPDYERYTRRPQDETTRRPTDYMRYPTTLSPDYERYTRRPQYDYTRTPNYERFTQTTTQPPYYTTRRTRPRQLNENNDSILGSFFDLLF